MQDPTSTKYLKRVPDGKPIRTCDRCGGVFPYARLQVEWTGLLVCRGPDTHDCYEEMHPSLQYSGPTDGSLTIADPRPPRDGHGADVPENTAGTEVPGSYAANLQAIRQRGLPQ